MVPECSPSPSAQFALAIEAEIEALKESPLRFPLTCCNWRRAGFRRFPYRIIFEVQENRIVVIACFHADAIRDAGSLVNNRGL